MAAILELVVAVDEQGGIGKNNQLLWHLPADLKHFKEITTGHPIIMGRKTYDSIGRALPNRRNMVISRHRFTNRRRRSSKQSEQCHCFSSQ